MQTAFYVSLSSQIALEKRLTTIATNVANASSTGYRATGVSFDAVLSKSAPAPTAYASAGVDFISKSQGDLSKTDNSLDVSVIGDGFFAIRTAAGVAYTRDGRMKMLETGELQTILGYPILDAGNSPIVLDPTAGPPRIFRDGMINQGESQAGALGLFSIDDSAALTRAENSSVIPSTPAIPILDFVRNGVAQGYLEGANVNPVAELTKLIMTQRSFENAAAAYDLMDSSQRNAVRTLGGG
jgi:flagellar basal-body rod protein FlgF